MRALILAAAVVLPLTACRTPGPPGMRHGMHVAAPSTAAEDVSALADSILAAARARDADRFAGYFEAGEGLVYVINTRRLTSQAALREAFSAMLGRQRAFDPRWTDRAVRLLAPEAAVFAGAFRTEAQDTSGTAWAARGVVTFTARRGPEGWRVVTWHTSEVVEAP